MPHSTSLPLSALSAPINIRISKSRSHLLGGAKAVLLIPNSRMKNHKI